MLSISRHAECSGESYQNVAKGIEFWEKNGLDMEITRQKRNRIFATPQVMEMTRPRGSNH